MSYWTRHICEIHGHIVEGRLGYLGGQAVILDGKLVSNQPFAGLGSPGHFFEIIDEHGKPRNVEVRFGLTPLGFNAAMTISVDGIQRARIPGASKDAPVRPVCRWCGYALEGLKPDRGEVKCPECGRHTRSTELGIPPRGGP